MTVVGTLRICSFPILLLLCLGAYWIGLNGPFLMDDFTNLPALREYGGVRNLETLRLYLFNGIAGPTGRPLSLLSFLIDGNAWPADPRPFKYTNLLLHLLTGCLLLWLAFRLALRHGRSEAEAGWVALLVVGFWLLHPLNVSTTLYVVQRMAILSALFCVAGLLAYVHGRSLLAVRARRGYVWMSAGLILGTLLAVLSKENGALLPVLALVLEGTVLADDRERRPSRGWQALFLWLPTLALLAYLVYLGVTGHAYVLRSFTVSERLLTESRVLFEYLYRWFLPFVPTRGLCSDDYPVSTSLFNPLSTLFACVGLAVLVASAFRYRERYPSVAGAVGFFLAGHLMESTTIPLELYFEHRNYLPAMLLFLPVAEFLVKHSGRQRLWPLFASVLLIGMAATTYRLARLWSDETRLFLYWAEQSPNSARAQGAAATKLEQLGRPELALAILSRAVMRQPDDIPLRLRYLVRMCYTTGLDGAALGDALQRFRSAPFVFLSYPLLEAMVEDLPDPNCAGLGFEQLHAVLNALAENRRAREPGLMRHIQHFRGVLFTKQNLPKDALAAFRESLRQHPDISAGLLEVSLLANRGFFAEALALLEDVRALPIAGQGVLAPRSTLDFPSEIERLQRMLEEDLGRSRKESDESAVTAAGRAAKASGLLKSR